MSSAADSGISAFKRVISGRKDLSESEKYEIGKAVDTAIANEPIPTIAIIGEAGVGKTTTLNALFNAGAEVGHSVPTTKTADGFSVEVFDHRGNKGDIRVIDMPGLGESIAKADELARLYAQELPAADVILWVHPVADRMLEFTQRKVIEIFGSELGSHAGNVVFGLNKADGMHPYDWRSHANIPSDTQLAHLKKAEEHFTAGMRLVLPRRHPVRVTTYSALQYYNLPRLFAMLMDAMPKKRRWVLEQRMDLANFIDKADPKFVANVQGRVPAGVAPTRPAPAQPAPMQLPPRDWIVSQMTDEEKRECLIRGVAPEEWWRLRGNR